MDRGCAAPLTLCPSLVLVSFQYEEDRRFADLTVEFGHGSVCKTVECRSIGSLWVFQIILMIDPVEIAVARVGYIFIIQGSRRHRHLEIIRRRTYKEITAMLTIPKVSPLWAQALLFAFLFRPSRKEDNIFLFPILLLGRKNPSTDGISLPGGYLGLQSRRKTTKGQSMTDDVP